MQQKKVAVRSINWNMVRNRLIYIQEGVNTLKKLSRLSDAGLTSNLSDVASRDLLENLGEDATDLVQHYLSEWLSGSFGESVWAHLSGQASEVKIATHSVLNAIRDPAKYVTEKGISLTRWVDNLIQNLDWFTTKLNEVLVNVGTESLSYQGFKVLNPDRLPDTVVKSLLDGIDFLVALFKKRGLKKVLDQNLKSFIFSLRRGDTALARYYPTEQQIQVFLDVLTTKDSRFFEDWVKDAFVHEMGHHIHMFLMPSQARREWDSGWLPVEQAQQARKKLLQEVTTVTAEDRRRYWGLLVKTRGVLSQMGLKGLDRMKAHAWLSRPYYSSGSLVTKSNLKWSPEGLDATLVLRAPAEMAKLHGYDPTDLKEMSFHLDRLKRDLRVLGPEASIDFPVLNRTEVQNYVKEDKQVEEAIEALQIPSEYGKTNVLEDFAETFTAFMHDPSKLSPTARFRIQRAFALSGLYGKEFLRQAKNSS